VTKLHGNIKPETVEERPVPDRAADPEQNGAGDRIDADRYVRIGNDRSDRDGGEEGRWYRVLEVEGEAETQRLTVVR